MTLRLSATLALIAALIGAPAAAPTPEPTAPAGTTWSLQPATADGPDGRVSLRHVVDAGGAASDAVALTNFGAETATFAVYASDGTVSDDGNFDLIPADEQAADGGSWITLAAVEGSSPREGGGIVLSVPGATTLAIPLEISVPADATPGDHPAGIVAELVPADSSTVQLASRVGVRAHLRVSGDIVATMTPEIVTTAYTPSWNPFAPGTVTLTYAVANSGNVRLGAQTLATLAGPFGLAGSTTSGEQREVLPGQAAATTVDIPVWPLFFSSGDVTATPAAVGEDEFDATLTASAAPFTVWTMPWAQLALLALLVGLFFLIRMSRARSSQRVQARIDAAVAAATTGDRADGAGVSSEDRPASTPR